MASRQGNERTQEATLRHRIRCRNVYSIISTRSMLDDNRIFPLDWCLKVPIDTSQRTGSCAEISADLDPFAPKGAPKQHT